MDTSIHEIIAFPTSEGYAMATFPSIVFVRSDGNFSHVFLDDGDKLHLTRQLKELEKFLPKEWFIRTHRQYLVNKFFVSRYNRKDSQLLLSNGQTVPVAVRKRKQLSRFFKMLE